MPAPTTLQEFWTQAIERGLFPLAIARGSKAPIGEGWNTWPVAVPHPAAGGVGFRCCPQDHGHSGFDNDEADPTMSARLLWAFREVLAQMGFHNIPVRWGARPRFLIPFFVTDGPSEGRTFTYANGSKLQLIGGQYVAYGPHAKTGQPYEWEFWDNWDNVPRLTKAQVQEVLARVPALAGTSLQLSAKHETCSEEELAEAVPQTQDEFQAGRNAAMRYMGLLRNELMGKSENRGSTIFSIVGILKYAAMHGMCTRIEIEQQIEASQFTLDQGNGGRTLREEIDRQELLPVLRGNLIMLAIMARRTLLQGLHDARTLPHTMVARTGFELSLEDDNNELPWLLYQRVLCGEVHFFTGHSGAGKSTVVSDLAVSYLAGRPWLDADVERTDGHVLWVAAEDDYGTERRMRYLLKQEQNAPELADRFHLIRGVPEPLAFEQQCLATVQSMAAMGKRVDAIVLDTWGASGLCFADNDTEAVLKAMFILKNIARRTMAATLITDHLPMNGEDNWQKGNGAKSGNAGFMYRVTAGKMDMVSIDCGKARGAPKAKSYTGKIISETYGVDKKGRKTTVNLFKRTQVVPQIQHEQTAQMRLAAMLPGVTPGDMNAVRSGRLVPFDNVAAEVEFKGTERPDYVATKAALEEMFGDDFEALKNSGHVRIIRGAVWAVHAPKGSTSTALTIWTPITPPTQGAFPWQ